jgi:hypothetical protein
MFQNETNENNNLRISRYDITFSLVNTLPEKNLCKYAVLIFQIKKKRSVLNKDEQIIIVFLKKKHDL